MTLFNFFEQTEDIETVSRYNGGWLKSVTGLDKTKTNGYSILGEFTKAGNYKHDYKNGLYLDCSKDGSRKNQEWNYHLFRVDQDGFHLIQTLENGGRNWACEFWENIEAELKKDSKTDKASGQDILNKLSETYSDSEIEELRQLLNKRAEKKYAFQGKAVTKTEFEGYLKINGLEKIEKTEFIEDYKNECLSKGITEEEFKQAEKGEIEKNALGLFVAKEIGLKIEDVKQIVNQNSECLTNKIKEMKFAKYYEYEPAKYVFAKAEYNGKLKLYKHILY